MLMYHSNLRDIGKADRYKKGWCGIKAPTVGEVEKIITKYAWGNCLWAGGVRLKVNFRYCSWLALDFDEGVTLQDGIDTWKDYVHLIGTTRNHQRPKKGVVCDRFRVVLRLGTSILLKDDYEFTAKKFISEYKADEKAKDAARLFWPCKEIVSKSHMGKVIKPLSEPIEIKKRRTSHRVKMDKILNTYYKKGRIIPHHVRSYLEFGVSQGSRNDVAYRVAKDLAKVGYTESEIVHIIMTSQIPRGKDLFSEAECIKTVGSACK